MFETIKQKPFESFVLIYVLAFLYFYTGILSFELLNGKNIINTGVFAPEGIALAFALFFGKRVLPGIFFGQLILAISNNINIFTSLEISLANSFEAYMAIILLKKYHIDTKLKTLRDVIGLIVIIVFILQVFSALFGTTALYLHSNINSTEFQNTIFSWWFGNIMGQLLFTPFLLLLFTYYKKINVVEYLLYGAVFGLYVYILEFLLGIYNPFLLLIFNIPIVIYIVANKGMLYGTFMSIILSIVTSISIYKGIVVFDIDTTFNNIINYNLFILLHTLTVLLVGIMFKERKQYTKDLQKKIDLEVTKNKEQQLMLLQQSRLAQMGEMIAMIAHQWRQPLNNLSLVNQLLISKYKKGKLNDEAVAYFKDNSKKQIDLMSRTIDDFRNFFRMEKTKTDFDVKDIIKNILDMTKPIYTSNSIKINFDVDADMSYITTGYPNALAQALLNIINNAKDALCEHEDISDKKINISLNKQNDTILLNIKDNAGGIADAIIDKIFDPYFSTKHEKNGTGLGLYMSKKIIEEQMDAKIEVSNDNFGANFKIFLKGKNDAVK